MNENDNTLITPPWYLFNAHFETIFPAVFRKVKNQRYHSERISTPDKDFVDVDFYDLNEKKSVILCHGLEGNSKKPYMKGMVNILLKNGFNCIAWNFRGCSGMPNNHAHSYHSGATEDLDLVIEKTIEKFPDNEIFLVGFSLGGNLILKYLGERSINASIKKAVAISAPLDLHSSCKEISKTSNWIYTIRFLYSLKKKIKRKAIIFPERINIKQLGTIKNLEEFDDQFTAPLHGFKDAMDYYTKCSSLNFLDNIRIPTLIINARNDPFLSKPCYPVSVRNKYISFDFPLYGGHLGFKTSNDSNGYYHENRAALFLLSKI